MRISLQIYAGPETGKTIWLEPGALARVGNSSLADIIVADDNKISAMHFSVDCSHDRCILIDLASKSGTFLNGKRTSECVLKHGDEIVAGGTRFVVAVEGADSGMESGTSAGDSGSGSEADERTRNVIQILRESKQPLYALLDAARDSMVLALLFQSELKYESLYEGPKGEQLMAAAPYLVELPSGNEFLEKLVRQGWGDSWGVYLTSSAPFAEIRKNFRRFLMVETPDKKQVYFRFYDPRVMRVFLPTCLPEEANQFFGPVQTFFAEGESPDTLLVFDTNQNGKKKTASVAPNPQPVGS